MDQEGFSNKTILIIAVIALMAGGGFWLYKKNKPAAGGLPVTSQEELKLALKYREGGWKTYQNKYGFEFQYPPEWRVVTDDQSKGQVKIVSWAAGEREEGNGFAKNGAAIEVTHEKEGITLKEARDATLKTIKSGPVKIFYESDRLIDGKQAHKITYLTEKGIGIAEYLIPVGKIVYRLKLSLSISADPILIKTVNGAFEVLPAKVKFGK